MATKEEFNHYQPLGNSDPAHTAIAPGGLSAKTPAMTPLMLDGTTRKLVVWDGTTTVLPLAFWRLLLTRPAPH